MSVHRSDPLVDLLDNLDHLRLGGRLVDGRACVFDVLAQRQGRGEVRHALASQLVANPPELVVGPVEVPDRLAMAREAIEVAALHPLADLAVDPRLPADTEGLSLGHRGSRAAAPPMVPVAGRSLANPVPGWRRHRRPTVTAMRRAIWTDDGLE